jgi:DNA-binding MarR family transcriptional regulator
MIANTKKDKIGHLLMHVCRMRGKIADQFMSHSRLYHGQGLLLLFISDHDGWTHSEIAEKLRISPAAVTKVIKRLEEEGYLLRQADEKDERVSRVFILDKGRSVVGELHSNFEEFNDQTFKDFSEEEMDQFEEYLKRIMINLRVGLQN